jgi:hypothetical protein
LNCTVISESDAALRVRISGNWEVDIYKEMVLAVEAIQPGPLALSLDEDDERIN